MWGLNLWGQVVSASPRAECTPSEAPRRGGITFLFGGGGCGVEFRGFTEYLGVFHRVRSMSTKKGRQNFRQQ